VTQCGGFHGPIYTTAKTAFSVALGRSALAIFSASGR
jgi:hypothetical protein